MLPRPRLGSLSDPAVERVRLKTPMSATGFVDGAWWPRSRDLVTEVPGLAAALADRIGPVWRVAFPLIGWVVTEPSVLFDERLVRLEGIATQSAYVVHVTGGNMRRVTLLVIPPHVEVAAAERALAAAARSDNEASPENILEGSGALPSKWVFPACETDFARWETDGGNRGVDSAWCRPIGS
ncbi:DUF5994 family protein [Amycolatopsis sp. lyj-112]|uniref:DUF5994 family protein n=1 Tax=Amycolatopsis sp. lyj-112 TaxID=2789288 RepID=UPI00397A104E